MGSLDHSTNPQPLNSMSLPVCPDTEIKVAQIYPKVAQNVGTTVVT